MNETDVDGLRALMRNAVTKAIENQTPFLVLYVNNFGPMGAACICKVSDLKEVLADNPDKEFVVICNITTDGEIQPSTGDIRLKHIKE